MHRDDPDVGIINKGLKGTAITMCSEVKYW